MKYFSEKVSNIFPIIIVIILILYFVKPSFMFKANGQTRHYGVGYDSNDYKKTLYTMQNVIIFTTILLWIFL